MSGFFVYTLFKINAISFIKRNITFNKDLTNLENQE